MKKFNSLTKAVPFLLLPVMGTAIATDINVPLTFTTLPAIALAPIQALEFGDVLSLTQSDQCTISVAAGDVVTSAQEGANLTDTTVYSISGGTVSAGELADDCAGGANAQIGIYEITSFADADITVTVTPGAAGDISYSPAGYVTNLLEATTPTRVAVSVGTPADVNASAALSPFAAAGTNRVIIGGTITNQVRLTAGAQYTSSFDIDVVYQ